MPRCQVLYPLVATGIYTHQKLVILLCQCKIQGHATVRAQDNHVPIILLSLILRNLCIYLCSWSSLLSSFVN